MNALPDRYASDELVLRDPSDGRTLAQRLSKRYAARITGAFVVTGREGSFAPLPDDLPAALAQALRSRGIDQLYSHQAEAWEATQSGAHVAVVTPTASGKSLCDQRRIRGCYPDLIASVPLFVGRATLAVVVLFVLNRFVLWMEARG